MNSNIQKWKVEKEPGPRKKREPVKWNHQPVCSHRNHEGKNSKKGLVNNLIEESS